VEKRAAGLDDDDEDDDEHEYAAGGNAPELAQNSQTALR